MLKVAEVCVYKVQDAQRRPQKRNTDAAGFVHLTPHVLFVTGGLSYCSALGDCLSYKAAVFLEEPQSSTSTQTPKGILLTALR